MKTISKGKVIIVGDSHQQISWLDAIIDGEGNFDYFVHLGDHFDSYNTIDNIRTHTIKNTCEWINEKLNDDRFIWLIGNHDVAYLASYTKTQYAPKNTFYNCSGWTRSKAQEYNKYISNEFLNKLELTCNVGGWTCVHGGFSEKHFSPFKSVEQNIFDLWKTWENDKYNFQHSPYHWIYYVSGVRGGTNTYSSPIWLDFDKEFKPISGVNQIVGHTTNYVGVRKNNLDDSKNFCIDGVQSCYAVWENGVLTFKIPEEKKL